MTIKGQQSVLDNLLRLSIDMRKQIAGQIEDTANEVRNNAIKSMAREEKTGTLHTNRGANLGDHQASAAGEAPAVDTGNLIGSINIKVQGVRLRAFVFTPVEYGLYLEFGTAAIAPRPWLRPALAKAEEKYRESIQKAFDDVERGFDR